MPCLPAKQADAELEHLPPAELERLAAEAAELQARAAAALRQARARLQGDGSAGVEAAPLAAAGPAEPGTAAEAAAVHAEQEAAPAAATGEPAVPASEGAAGAAEPAAELGEPTGPLLLAPALAELAAMAEGTACSRVEPVATQPAELPRLLRLCALLVTLTELALLASAAVVRRGSCGLVRPPQRLVLLPADAMRWAAAALLLGVGAAAGVREALASGRTVRRS